MKKNPWESKRGIKALLAMGWTNRDSWVGMDWVLARSKAIDWLDVQVKAGRAGWVHLSCHEKGWRYDTGVQWLSCGYFKPLDSALIGLVLSVAKLPVQP